MLVANRGEIAIRILTAAREFGLRTVAVYSEPDREALHVRAADQAVCLGPAPAAESYLSIPAILDAARSTGADAIHPGYGFLSENAEFAAAVQSAGLVFIGPPAHAIDTMGDKAAARRIASTAGVPVIPGYDDEDQSDATLLAEAQRIGFPLLLKPAAGGGGKGMRRVAHLGDVAEALQSCRREAMAAFGDDRMILERYLAPIRHVEIQIFADGHGHCVHLFERECSVQRRHQKIIEESPSPVLLEETRERMGAAAVTLARAVQYQSAGTVEFVLDEQGHFYFLEMNTRLQVEHPVTEAITGVDLARWQLREASGAPLPLAQDAIGRRGHAIECRLYAEDPENGFLPAAGPVRLYVPPQGPGIRMDSGIRTGSEVGVHYDPILAKLIVWDEDRTSARRRMARALRETVILGLRTNLGFLRDVIEHPAFAAGETWTDFVDRHRVDLLAERSPVPLEALALAHLARATRDTSSAPGNGDNRPTTGDPGSPWSADEGFRLGIAQESA